MGFTEIMGLIKDIVVVATPIVVAVITYRGNKKSKKDIQLEIEKIKSEKSAETNQMLQKIFGELESQKQLISWQNSIPQTNEYQKLIDIKRYAETKTAERTRKVITGYQAGKSAVTGTGGNFSFYDLGEQLLIGECLNESVDIEKIREYIWFMETKAAYVPANGENKYYLGKHNDAGYYFYYEPERVTVLDYAFLATITEKESSTIIYADRCSISDEKLSQMGIVFKKIPRDISRL